MRSSFPGWKTFLKDLGLRIGGAVGAVGLIFILGFVGNRFEIGVLQSKGGLLISVIVLGEAVFFSLLVLAVLRGDL